MRLATAWCMSSPHPPVASPAQAAKRLTLLLESTGEGIFGVDMAGRCTSVNSAAAQTPGWRPEAVLGKNMHALMHHAHADGRHYPECDCPIFNAFRQGLPCRVDGEVLWRADVSCFPAAYLANHLEAVRETERDRPHPAAEQRPAVHGPAA